jgi:hypothetical protein
MMSGGNTMRTTTMGVPMEAMLHDIDSRAYGAYKRETKVGGGGAKGCLVMMTVITMQRRSRRRP